MINFLSEMFNLAKAVTAVFLLLSFLTGISQAQPELMPIKVRLAWDQNPEPDVIGYKIYYGTESGNYSSTNDVGNVTTAVIEDLQGGVKYFFAATAYNATLESDFSNEISYGVWKVYGHKVVTIDDEKHFQFSLNTGLPDTPFGIEYTHDLNEDWQIFQGAVIVDDIDLGEGVTGRTISIPIGVGPMGFYRIFTDIDIRPNSGS